MPRLSTASTKLGECFTFHPAFTIEITEDLAKKTGKYFFQLPPDPCSLDLGLEHPILAFGYPADFQNAGQQSRLKSIKKSDSTGVGLIGRSERFDDWEDVGCPDRFFPIQLNDSGFWSLPRIGGKTDLPTHTQGMSGGGVWLINREDGKDVTFKYVDFVGIIRSVDKEKREYLCCNNAKYWIEMVNDHYHWF